MRSSKQIENDIKNMWKSKVARLQNPPDETFDQFLQRSEALSVASNISLKAAAKKRLNSTGYTSYEARLHKQVTGILKEEGMTSRLYRMGGKTSFAETSFDSKKEEDILIEGDYYHTTGTYKMGDVKVEFLSSDNNSTAQYIRLTSNDKIWIQKRKGEKM